MSTAIYPVRSYDDPALRPAIAALLRVDPGLTVWLAEADPGRLVVVKPNWVQEAHETAPDVWEPVMTHPDLLLIVLSELASMMGGRGTICVCDAPHTYANFPAIVARGGFQDRFAALTGEFPNVRWELSDLRRETWVRKEGVVVDRIPNPPDPRGYTRVDLGRDSLLYGFGGEGRYYGADYDSRVVNAHHRGPVQEYLLAGSAMTCDLFVNVPKLKTHKKTGITCCLKNLVGINGDKNWLPHHTDGTPETGGDEYPSRTWIRSIEARAKRVGRNVLYRAPGIGPWLYRKSRGVGRRMLGDSDRVVRNGNWIGNDTCWRMALDLNRGLLFANADGSWTTPPRARRYLAVVDGIIGGQGNGPLCPDPVASGVLVGGTNPADIDAVACRLMGFDPRRLPIISHAFADHRWPIATIQLSAVTALDHRTGITIPLDDVRPAVPGGFVPHFGWTDLRSKA
jgi:uncharacterized protein (DUF362 family)